jgi:hypothetical protein
VKSLEFHNGRGDFEKWVEKSFHDRALATELKKIRLSKHKGESMRRPLIKAVKKRLDELGAQLQAVTDYF